jgi:ABC-type Fe3+-hydroxamate transport system substrate-binding protein
MLTLVPHTDRVAAGKLVLLILATASLTLACASVGRSWSRLPRGTSEANHVKLVPGVWDRVEALSPGARLVITVASGDRVDGAFSGLQSGILLLTDAAGGEFSIPRSEVRRIIALAYKDDLTNGVLIGAGIGLGAAVVILAAIGAGDGYVLPSAKWGAPLTLASAGALLGAVIDRSRKGERVLYQAPTTGTR